MTKVVLYDKHPDGVCQVAIDMKLFPNINDPIRCTLKRSVRLTWLWKCSMDACSGER